MVGGGVSFTTVLYAVDDRDRVPCENLLALRERLDTVKADLGPFAAHAYAAYASGEGERKKSRRVLRSEGGTR